MCISVHEIIILKTEKNSKDKSGEMRWQNGYGKKNEADKDYRENRKELGIQRKNRCSK